MAAERPKTATSEDWMFPPQGGWTYEQIKDLDLPFEWELVDGAIVVRGQTPQWHDVVRDGLCFALRLAKKDPYAVNVERCVLVDAYNPCKPDIAVYDKRGLDVFTTECVPVTQVALLVEVVSPGSKRDDRVRKPDLFASGGVPAYWRVERGSDGMPVVHEFRLDESIKGYVPAEPAVHEKTLTVEYPFPVEVDLASLVEA